MRRLRKLADGTDHLGKRHGVPGKRIMERVRDAHDLEASLASNRIPAMWDHPFFTELYEDIVALDRPPDVGDPTLLEANPDQLRGELESRYRTWRARELSAGAPSTRRTLGVEEGPANPCVSVRDLATAHQSKGVGGFIEDIKGNLRWRARAVPGLETSSVASAGVLDVFGKMRHCDVSEGFTSAPPSKSDWIRLLRAYGVHGRAQDAIDAADQLQSEFGLEKNEVIFSTLVACCADARRPDLADAVFNEMRWAGYLPSAHAWSALIHAHVSGRQLDTAFTIMRNMAKDGIEPTLPVYTSLLTGIFHVLPREECFTEANELWFAMRLASVEPDLMAYTAMIRCCVRAREIERGLNFVDEMRQQGTRPSIVTYNSLIRGAAVTPLWHPSRALVTDEILNLMEQDEVLPNRGTFNALIRTCASVGDVVNARVYFNEMEGHGLQPDATTYAEMLSSIAAAQALGRRRKVARYLTRPRGWPIRPRLGSIDKRTADEKVAHLTWDVIKQDSGRKFEGFLKDGQEVDLFFEDEMDGRVDKVDEQQSSDGGVGYDAYEGLDVREEGTGTVTPDEADENELESLNWQCTIQKARQDARAIVEKGQRKHANRVAHDHDLEVVEKVSPSPLTALPCFSACSCVTHIQCPRTEYIHDEKTTEKTEPHWI